MSADDVIVSENTLVTLAENDVMHIARYYARCMRDSVRATVGMRWARE
jgi:hypothetical protein